MLAEIKWMVCDCDLVGFVVAVVVDDLPANLL